MTSPDLPRGVRLLLSLALPLDWRADILRDLEEAWHLRRRSHGPVVARLWLWSQAVAFASRFLAARLGEARIDLPVDSGDARLALRSFKHAPLVSALSVAALTVGIAAATGGFTLVTGIFFSDPPFEDAERIVLLEDYNQNDAYVMSVRADEFVSRRRSVTAFEALAAFYPRSVVLGDPSDGAAVVPALFVTDGLLEMSGTSPALGRLPDRDDVRAGRALVVLPHSVWVDRMGRDLGVIGRPIAVDGAQMIVAAVMPESFGFPWQEAVWVPFDAEQSEALVTVLGKLRAGTTTEEARADLAAVAQPDPERVSPGESVAYRVSRLEQALSADDTLLQVAGPVLVLVLLVLLMAANVANLLLARNAGRARELALRLALGATRARLVGQLVLETGAIVLTATVLGVWLSQVGVSRFERSVQGVPLWADLSINPRSLLFVCGLAVLITLVSGVGPSVRATSNDPGEVLKDGGRHGSGIRFGRLTGSLIVAQVAVSVGFLLSAALLGQTLLSFDVARYGLPSAETLIGQVYFNRPAQSSTSVGETAAEARARSRAAHRQVMRTQHAAINAAILELDGPRVVSWASRFPGHESDRERLQVEGGPSSFPRVEIAEIDEHYFDVLDASPVRGRFFTADDVALNRPVVIVNEPFVQERLGGGDPLGRRVRLFQGDAPNPDRDPWLTVVGVVRDLGLSPGDPDNAAAAYVPLGAGSLVRVGVRGAGDLSNWAAALVAATRRADPSIQVHSTSSLDEMMRRPVELFARMGSALLALGGLALVLSGASIHALSSCAVRRRTREIGIRRALGASPGRVIALVVGRSGIQLGAGLVLGGLVAFAVMRVVQGLPWEVRLANPAALLVVLTVILVATATALAQPTSDALSIRPASAMRDD